MSYVFQNIDPPPPSPPECVPPAFVAGGGHTRRVERGVGGQYFGSRNTQLCTLPISNPLCLESSQTEVSVYDVYSTNQFQNTFADGGGGGGGGGF
jgi:hypothetical protein